MSDKPSRPFLQRVRDSLGNLVKDGKISQEDADGIVRHARGHAGGVAAAYARHAAQEATVTLGEHDGHSHEATVNGLGEGTASAGETGHTHAIKGWKCGEAEGHTHTLDRSQAMKGMKKKADEGEVMIDSSAFMYGGPRLEKTDDVVQYRPAETPNVCGLCRFWRYGECAVVEGSINAVNTCDLWEGRYIMAELADVGARVAHEGEGERQDGSVRLFSLQDFAQPPASINVLPLPGEYKHPQYGTISITQERNARFVDNFYAGVYQEKLPIDVEHETKLSGAVGWITGLKQNSDGSVDATVEWSDRGLTAIQEDRFKYFSPEWYDVWIDPVAGQKYQDVLVGGAITTRPFFKDKALRPLVASENGRVLSAVNEERSSEAEIIFEPLQRHEAAQPPAPANQTEPPTPPPAPIDTPIRSNQEPSPKETTMPTIEELTQQMSEVSTKVETLSTQLTEAQTNLSAEKEARVAAETRVKTLEDASRRRRFSDMVEGRGGETDGLRWYGEIDQHVQTLTSLAEAVGEESDAFKNYVASQVNLAKTIAASPLMQEVGTSQANTEPDSLAGLVKKYREDNPGKSEAEATDAVLAANPHLYAESVRAQNRAIKRGD